jgi:hypothetical protein
VADLRDARGHASVVDAAKASDEKYIISLESIQTEAYFYRQMPADGTTEA